MLIVLWYLSGLAISYLMFLIMQWLDTLSDDEYIKQKEMHPIPKVGHVLAGLILAIGGPLLIVAGIFVFLLLLFGELLNWCGGYSTRTILDKDITEIFRKKK